LFNKNNWKINIFYIKINNNIKAMEAMTEITTQSGKCDFCRKNNSEVEKYKFAGSENSSLQSLRNRETQAKKKEKYKARNLEWICSGCLEAKKNKSRKSRKKAYERKKNYGSLLSRMSQVEGEVSEIKTEIKDQKEKKEVKGKELWELKQKHFKVNRWGQKYKYELSEEQIKHIKSAKTESQLYLFLNDLRHVPVEEESKENVSSPQILNIDLFSLKTRFHKILWGTLAVALIIALFASWWKWKAIEEWLDKPIEDEEEDL
jgi:DNA repair ATPase RecN